MNLSPASLLLSLVLLPFSVSLADDSAKTDSRYPFRTDFANANLPWYQPKALEFPPHHSDRRINGQLVSADFIHRTGQFRMSKTGEIVDFSMPPYASVHYLKAEADLRDVPLGTDFLFFLNDDGHGHFTRLATMQDQFSIDAGHSFSYRLDEMKLGEGKLLATKQSLPKNQPDLGKAELHVNAATRVWKDDKQIKLEDLEPGDALLYNLRGRTAASPGVCTDIWVGAETHRKATEKQAAKFAAFVKRRGLPGWIEKTEGNKMTVTLFSDDPPTFKKTWKEELTAGKDIGTVVANDELRTWNPPVDREKGSIVEVQSVPTECYGCSGVRLVVQVAYMLEGFRRGHIVRFFGSGWPVENPPYGESLMNYGYSGARNPEIQENTAREYPLQYPYRTDFGNEDLPWYPFHIGELPPEHSEHRIVGELVKVDSEKQTGQFRTERTGETVAFHLLPGGTVQYLNANATLADIPLGTRCTFALYQDKNGAFTQAWKVSDDFSHFAADLTKYRVTALNLDQGRLDTAWQMSKMKNYNGDMEQVPDLGESILLVSPETRVWKEDKQVTLQDLAVGDLILANLTSEQTGQPSRCTDIWIGEDTHKAVTEQQAKKLSTAKK